MCRWCVCGTVLVILDGYDKRTDAELHAAIADGHRRFCAAHRDLLADVAEHDRRQAWRDRGATGEEAYLMGELAVSWRTARDWVKVARALERRPDLAVTFADGEVTFDQLSPMIDVLAAHQPNTIEPMGPFDSPTVPDPAPSPAPDPNGPAPGPGGDPSGGSGDPSGEGGDPSGEGGDPSGEGGDPSGEGGDPSGEGGDLSGGCGVPDLSAGPDGDPIPDSGSGPEPFPGPEGGCGQGNDPAPDPGPDPADLSRMSAAQLAKMAGALRRRSLDEANKAHRKRRLLLSDRDNGSGLHLEADLFDDQATFVRAAIDEYLRTCDQKDPVTGRYPPAAQSRADALVEMAGAYLSMRERTTHRPAVIVHTQAEVVAGGPGWALTADAAWAAETVQRMACWCQLEMMVEQGVNMLFLGRTHRLPTWQLAEAVRRRDGGCRFPGCRRTAWTITHHIVWWEHDGPTDHTNLCCLCRQHHRLVHEGRWTVTGDPRHDLTFTSPDGKLKLTSRPEPNRPPPGIMPTQPDDVPVPDDEQQPPGHPGRDLHGQQLFAYT